MRVFAGFLEEICQIHLKSAVGIARKTNGLNKGFVVTFRVKIGAVNAAKVDKVERGATHNEHRFKFIFFGNVRKVNDRTAFGTHFKLTNAAKLAIDQCLVGQELGAKGNTAKVSNCFLFFFITFS